MEHQYDDNFLPAPPAGITVTFAPKLFLASDSTPPVSRDTMIEFFGA